jgi:hypothetical protein
MRSALALLALAACGTSVDHEPLRIDVVAVRDRVEVFAYEASAPAPCPNAFPEVGITDSTTDALQCDQEPAIWLDRLQLVADATVVDDEVWLPPEWPVLADPDATEVVLIADDGAEIRIPLPTAAAPVPTIDDVQDEQTSVSVLTTTVTWSAPGAASAVVLIGNGFGGPRTHVAAGEPATLTSSPDSAIRDLVVYAFAAPVDIVTDFGVAHVWNGDLVLRDLTMP